MDRGLQRRKGQIMRQYCGGVLAILAVRLAVLSTQPTGLQSEFLLILAAGALGGIAALLLKPNK
jgi:hypothetical protein